jgi:hypothetical protein
VRCTGAARWKGSLSPVLWGRPCAVPLAGLPDRGSPRPPAGTTAGAHRTRVLAPCCRGCRRLGACGPGGDGAQAVARARDADLGQPRLASWWPAWPGCSCPRSSCWRRSSASPGAADLDFALQGPFLVGLGVQLLVAAGGLWKAFWWTASTREWVTSAARRASGGRGQRLRQRLGHGLGSRTSRGAARAAPCRPLPPTRGVRRRRGTRPAAVGFP